MSLAGAAAHAASWTDFLFGSKSGQADKPAVASERRIWRIGEFTAVQRAEREAGATPNQQPVTIAPETLRQLLAPVRLVVGKSNVALFHPDELGDLIEPLSEALSVAGPGDDLLLLSTHRRGEGLLRAPTGLTARVFVEGDALNLIAHDARRDFVNAYIGSRIPPTFTFGSRTATGTVTLLDPGATLRRADWVAIPLQRVAAAPVATPAPAAVMPAAAPVPQAAPAPAPAPRTTMPASADEIEQRLLTLKRLRERGLISEEEYQQKRREILQAL
jgi:hypothetical protein